MNIRKLTMEEVDFDLECLPEDTPVRGNAMNSGEDDYDREVENKILADLEWNQWAWCCAHVIARWKGFKGDDYLGGCSYDSEEQFRAPGGDWDDMKQQALDDLQANIERELIEAEELIERVA